MAANSNDSKPGRCSVAPFPAEHVLAHQGIEWKKSALASLAAAHLAVTAETGELRSLDEIIDTPLSSIPQLPPTHRDYERRMVDRMKVAQENQRNELKRKRLLLEAWDEVFQTLHACTMQFAPLLHTMMYDACDMRKQGIVGSHFDGPRAWRILDSRISAGERTKADKLYYDKCLAAQKASRLPDHCNADAFTKRAIAFVLFIMPNLAQKYTQRDAADYIVEMMPPSMREAGKRIQHDCIADGTYLDLMNLIKVCEAEVFEMQKPTSNGPQLVLLAGAVGLDNGSFVSSDGFPLTSMSETCGMELRSSGKHPAFAGIGSLAGDKSEKWCDQCPHPRNLICFCDPSYVGPPPPSVWEDRAKWKGLMAARDANARAKGVTAPRVASPTKEAIAKFKEVKQRRDEARKKGGGVHAKNVQQQQPRPPRQPLPPLHLPASPPPVLPQWMTSSMA